MFKFGHVRWFAEESPIPANTITPTEVATITGVTAGALAALHFIEAWLDKQMWYNSLIKQAARWHEEANAAVRVLVGTMAIIASQTDYILAPNLTMASEPGWLRTALLVFGLLLVVGFLVRDVAILLTALYVYILLQFPSLEAAEHLEYLGLTFFVLAVGPGKLALDNLIKKPQWHLKLKPYALPVLRVSVGISFVLLAFSEKFLDIDMALHFLGDYHWNFLSLLGLSDRFFVLMAGTIELILGLALIFNIASRVVILIIFSTFVLTASLLGLTEVIGHLFGLAVLLAIWFTPPTAQKQTSKTA